MVLLFYVVTFVVEILFVENELLRVVAGEVEMMVGILVAALGIQFVVGRVPSAVVVPQAEIPIVEVDRKIVVAVAVVVAAVETRETEAEVGIERLQVRN